jgi:hypothetical protein
MRRYHVPMLARTTRAAVAMITVALAVACSKPEPLTAAKAAEILGGWSFKREPVYAEVPQKVWWTPKSPKDDYDEKAVRTLRNLERAGLVTVTESVTADSATYVAKTTKKGFPVLGTAPSHRGPVFRAKIADKRYDGIRDFVRHPNEPTVGHAQLIWHYENPSPWYELFETKINKPLNTRFASHVSFWYDKHQWRFEVNVKKVEAVTASGGAVLPFPQ